MFNWDAHDRPVLGRATVHTYLFSGQFLPAGWSLSSGTATPSLGKGAALIPALASGAPTVLLGPVFDLSLYRAVEIRAQWRSNSNVGRVNYGFQTPDASAGFASGRFSSTALTNVLRGTKATQPRYLQTYAPPPRWPNREYDEQLLVDLKELDMFQGRSGSQWHAIWPAASSYTTPLGLAQPRFAMTSDTAAAASVDLYAIFVTLWKDL